MDQSTGADGTAAVMQSSAHRRPGRPRSAILGITGGFGVVIGFAHDWANREATMRSWELVARYVFPEFDGSVTRLRASQQYLHDNQADLMAGASRAVMAKVMAHEGAAAALGVTLEQLAARKSSAAAPQQSEFRPGAGLPTEPAE